MVMRIYAVTASRINNIKANTKFEEDINCESNKRICSSIALHKKNEVCYLLVLVGVVLFSEKSV